MRLLIRFVVVVLLSALLLAGGMLAVAPHAADVVTANSSTREDLELRPLAQRSLIFDRNGNVLATLHAEENRSPVSLEQVPQRVVDTILAVEDENFYNHGGVNLQASFRRALRERGCR